PKDFYYYPFGGPHPIRDKQEVFPKRSKRIQGKPKISVFLSGGGTNLQQIIEGIENNKIDAEIIDVVSNKADAYGLERAKKHTIPTTVLPYQGEFSDQQKRAVYDKSLINHIEKTKPDLIVLAGWMMVLGNTFLEAMQQWEIPVINLHPALMTEDHQPQVKTSKGAIPVLRGQLHEVLEQTFAQNLPLNGVTVHQIIPADIYDTGPIIISAEVSRKASDTKETYEKKIHQTEHLLLPTAIKRVLHVMQSGIDVSKGEFPW
ncbi:MAG: phosphoribosylglycinamide formyltransferase, partial [Acidobacteriota bacterium]